MHEKTCNLEIKRDTLLKFGIQLLYTCRYILKIKTKIEFIWPEWGTAPLTCCSPDAVMVSALDVGIHSNFAHGQSIYTVLPEIAVLLILGTYLVQLQNEDANKQG